MPSEVVKTGEDKRLPFNGGRIHQKPGTFETTGRKTRGIIHRHPFKLKL